VELQRGTLYGWYVPIIHGMYAGQQKKKHRKWCEIGLVYIAIEPIQGLPRFLLYSRYVKWIAKTTSGRSFSVLMWGEVRY